MRLNFFKRPVVVFDPLNRKHRKDYAEFLKTGSWKSCDVRYELDEPVGELQAAIQRKMLTFYTSREFNLNNPRG